MGNDTDTLAARPLATRPTMQTSDTRSAGGVGCLLAPRASRRHAKGLALGASLDELVLAACLRQAVRLPTRRSRTRIAKTVPSSEAIDAPN